LLTDGFIPDIYRRIRKYNLKYVLDCYIKEGIFPLKLRWKIILTSNIFRPDERVRLEFLTNVFQNYSVFSSVQGQLTVTTVVSGLLQKHILS